MNTFQMPVTRSSQVRLRAGVLAADVDQDFVLMRPELGHFYGFNAIGNMLWPRLEKTIRVGDLIEELSLRFDADPMVIERDVLAFVADLSSKGFVELVD